jgi:hypothetical protein
MKRTIYTPEWAARRAEAQARAHLQRERTINCVIERRNPCLPSTARYQRGPLPPWHPRFGSPADYVEYLARREMGRFDPHVDYPTP